MGLSFILLMIVLGLLLIAVEFFLMPGTLVAAVTGMILLVSGVVMGFSTTPYGLELLAASSVVTIALLAGGYRTLGAKGVSLDSALDGKVNELNEEERQNIKTGDMGIAFGDIKPTGKAIINGIMYAVYSQGGFIDDKANITVVSVASNKVTVKIA